MVSEKTAARAIINPKGVARLQGGHPWIFRSDVLEVKGAEHGDVVFVQSPRGAPLGTAFYSATSQITLRLLGSDAGEMGPKFFHKRIAEAMARRGDWAVGRDAYRVVFAESDRLPSIIIDRYGPHFVIQTLSAAADRWKGIIAQTLQEDFGAASVTERNDAPARQHEELPLISQILLGTPAFPITIREGSQQFEVDPLEGQKTGLYLDQAQNRMTLAPFLRGRVLDAFCYQGGFACHAAVHADDVLAVDGSAAMLEGARRNADRNSLKNINFQEANIFDLLHELYDRGERFNGIILDPPAFVRARSTLAAGIRGYKEINLRAVKLLKAGGILITSSCSQNLQEEMLLDLLTQVSVDTGRGMAVIQKCGQPPDHPVLLTFPESYYLKTLVMRLD